MSMTDSRINFILSKMVIILLVFSFGLYAKDFSTTPTTNGGKKWRVAFCQGGNFVSYVDTFKDTVKGLQKLGWIEPMDIPSFKDPSDTKSLWNWLSKNAKSEYIEFVENAYYSSDWDKEKRKKIQSEIIDRVNKKKDIDMIIAVGTWAGSDLANDLHTTPTMNMSVSNPLDAKIIKSATDSGRDHIHSKIDPDRYKRHVRIFYDIFKFKKLGIIYEDSEEGRVYSAMKDIEFVAKELGFEIIECHTKASKDKKEVLDSALKCYEKLATEVDAIYKTVHTQLDFDSIKPLLEITYKNKIPTFSQYGPQEVKYGVLMSISALNFHLQGYFHANAIAKVFNGAKPRELNMILEDPPNIAINMEVAKKIGYKPSIDVLNVADTIIAKIEEVKKKR